MISRKVFIARCTEDITADDLRQYFTKFGEVVDVFIPRPFRAFAFVTFSDPKVARALCGEDHIIKGASVHVTTAAPKNSEKNESSNRGGGGGGSGSYTRMAHTGARGPPTPGGWGQGKPIATVATVQPVPDPNMANQFGMNLFNHAMLAAAQAVLQGQGPQGQIPGQQQPVAQGPADPFAAQNTRGYETPRQNQGVGFFSSPAGQWGTSDNNTTAGGYTSWGGGNQQSGWS